MPEPTPANAAAVSRAAYARRYTPAATSAGAKSRAPPLPGSGGFPSPRAEPIANLKVLGTLPVGPGTERMLRSYGNVPSKKVHMVPHYIVPGRSPESQIPVVKRLCKSSHKRSICAKVTNLTF